ncbi:MAG: hypothetical protein WCF90_10635 [Methanomicrobiales archaeon]
MQRSTGLCLKNGGLKFRSIVIFYNQEEIYRKALAKFTDVYEMQFPNLHGNKDRFLKYVQKTGGMVTG